MGVLITKLSPTESLETNMSAQLTICDLIENRENRDLWGVLVQEENMERIKSYAMDREATPEQRVQAWNILVKTGRLLKNSMENKVKADRDFPMNSSDSDDIIVRHDSDEEDGGEGSGETPATLAFWSNLPGIEAYLELAGQNEAEPIHR